MRLGKTFPLMLVAILAWTLAGLIADTLTYGNYFTMRGDGPYRIALTISRAEAAKPVMLEFSYDHRTR